MRWLANTSLGIKLTLLLLFAFGLFLASNVGLLVYNTQSFTDEIGNERVQDALITIQEAIENVTAEVTTDVSLLAADVTFFQAVGRRNTIEISQIIARANLSQGVYKIDVVDGDGTTLFSSNEEGMSRNLLPQELGDEINSALLIEEVDGEVLVGISASVRVVSVTGNVLGGLRVTRTLDEAFLQTIVSGQRRVLVGLLLEGEVVAESEPIPNFGLDAEALTGSDATYIETFSAANTPYTGAYLPLGTATDGSQVTLLALIDLSELYSFQNRVLTNTIIVFLLLVVFTVSLTYFLLYRIAINPIDRLKAIAQEMTSGEYDTRIPVTNSDELGQLAMTFNTMANAVQQREEGLRTARESAERSDQVKSAFLASMSHELRTPLNAIINFTKFVAKGSLGEVNEDQKETLFEVVDSALHLLNLINDILDMSKIESGSLTLFVKDDVDLTELIQQAVGVGKGLIEEKPVVFHTNIAEQLPSIRGDRQRLLQVLLNILSNACKFTQQGEVSVNATYKADEVSISITDTGPGIAPEDQEAVFEAFKQTPSGLRRGGGTGLGMPITKSLVEAHGGRIQLESCVGEGTTVTVTLPVKSEILSLTLA